MYDLFAPRNLLNSSGYYMVHRRLYNSEDEKKNPAHINGKLNPEFKVGKRTFYFNIVSTKQVEKKQPITGLVYLVDDIIIETKEIDKHLVEGGYIEFDDKLWVIKTSNTDVGPNKAVYGMLRYNPLAKTVLELEEFTE